MSIRLNEIQIAGAGAGKTYSLAKRLINEYNNTEDNKSIYAITFTNAAKKNIKDRVNESLGFIPSNIIITTIHGFLLNEIIYPFNKLIYGFHFNKAVSIDLPYEPKFKRYKLKKLNENNIIHNEQVFKKAKMILSKKGKKIIIKEKIDIIMEHIEDAISCILIDEAQDMDKDAIEVFTILSKLNIYIYMVGDPKQAIKYNGVFEDFCNKIKNGEYHRFKVLENINTTKRVPVNHLKLSNMFCMPEENQINEDDFKGKIAYIFLSEANFDNLLKRNIEEKGLAYISKSNPRFNTKKVINKNIFPPSVVNKLKNINTKSELSFDIWIEAMIEELNIQVQNKGIYKALQLFKETLNITLTRQEYAQMRDMFSNTQVSASRENHKYEVISIDRAKGLEADFCLYIIDNAQFQYFMGYKKERNKEFNRLYVALTRSKDELILVFDDHHIKNMIKTDVEDYMNKLNIPKYNLD